MWHIQLFLVSCCFCIGVISIAVTVQEGDSVTIDCGFQTTVSGGNLLWQVIINGSEIPLGFIVPGDHFCGIDTIQCALHTNGSITLFNVTLSDGVKYYRCLRGDKEGYHFFSHVNLTVVSKESLGHPVIQPPTESKANVYKIKDKVVIHSYEEPTCEDKEDGTLIVTCSPPSGLIVDKVYHQIRCDCTDSDGNSNSLNITVNTHMVLPTIQLPTGSKANVYVIRNKGVIHGYVQPTCVDDEDGALSLTCYPPSGVMVDKVYDQVDCNCADSDGNSNSLNITVNKPTRLWENAHIPITVLSVIVVCLCFVAVVFGIIMIWKLKQVKFTKESKKKPKSTTKAVNNVLLTNLDEERPPPTDSRVKLPQANGCDTPLLSSREQTSGENSEGENDTDNGGVKKQNNDFLMEERELVLLNQYVDVSDMRQMSAEKEAECAEASGKINELEQMSKTKDGDMSVMRQRLAEKEAECVKKAEKIDELQQMNQKKDGDMSVMRQRLAEKEAECVKKAEKIDELQQMNQKKAQEQKENKELESHLPSSEERLTLKGKAVKVPEDETSASSAFNSVDGKEISQPSIAQVKFPVSYKSGLDEPDFTVCKSVDEEYPLWKEFMIADAPDCKGFDIDFTCEGPGLKLVLRESNDDLCENICSIDFDGDGILFKHCKKPVERIQFTMGETTFSLLLGNDKKELRLYQGSPNSRRCLKENVDMKNRKFHLLVMYKCDSCETTVLDTAQLQCLSK